MATRAGDDRRDRLKELFAEGAGVATEGRDRWLDEACGADLDLRAELESLLLALDRAGDFLESPAVASTGVAAAVLADPARAPSPSLVGRSIGPYRIVRELGHGGMGVVYLGARDDEAFEKLVAIKVVQAGYRPTLLRRFDEERRILAALDHPNVARLLDAGTTADGLPYVVMEYVEGEPIDAWCRERGLSIRQRLELFRQVCAAVQYSHQRLVVHRDIKAGNILVDAQGTPKLLDFGIAKMLAPGADGLATTRTALRALTPESASPEQVRGEPVTVSSDVYSLGVLLYHLLTQRSPYSSRPTSEADVVRAICEEQPARPSDAVRDAPALEGAEDARATARRLGRELRGDLDLIVLKALRKEPERRYASVEQLAADVERHLAGLPVRAAPDSWSYRAGKFLRRRRLAAAVVAAAAVATLAGAGVSLHQARIARRERASAEQRFDMVRRLAHAVIFDFNEALEPVPGSTAARKLVVAKAIEYLDGLLLQQPGDRALLAELAEAYLRVGDVQGDPSRPNLGDAAGALDSYGHALDLYSRLNASDPSIANRTGLAAAHRAIGWQLWARGDGKAARSHFEESVRLYGASSAADPGNSSHRRHLADCRYLLGQVALREGNTASAAVEFGDALRLYDSLLAADPGEPVARRGRAITYMKLGDTQPSAGQALAWYRKAAAALDELAAGRSAPADVPRLAALAALRIAEGLEEGSPREGETFAARAIAYLKPAVAADSSNAQTRGDLGYAELVLGQNLKRQGRRREAAEALTSGARLLEGRLAANPNSAEDHRLLGISRLELGELASARNDVRAALRSFEAARPLLEGKDVRPSSLSLLAELYADLGDADLASARAAGGVRERDARRSRRDWYAKSAALWREIAAQRPLDPSEAEERRKVELVAGAR
ncbi:MAG: protein kinase domain-containing protein [Betaproteobacteria bacterium]